MRNPKVHPLKTIMPIPGGWRKIVFPNGKLEHTAVIRAPDDWDVLMAIDDSEPTKFYCVCISPEGDAVTVERWTANKNASRIEITGADVIARFGDPLTAETNDIVDEVKADLD